MGGLRTLAAAAVLAAPSVLAQPSSGGDFAVETVTVDGGGGRSSGGAFVVEGTIAQPEADAEPAQGGEFELTSGFWAGDLNLSEDALFADSFEN